MPVCFPPKREARDIHYKKEKSILSKKRSLQALGFLVTAGG
jgi:hypothetical protein